MRVHTYASFSHYHDHLSALYRGLPARLRGDMYIGRRFRENEPPPPGVIIGHPPAGDAVIIAGIPDLQAVGYGRPLALLEHGSGQFYESRLASNPGGPDRDGISLFLHPNYQVATLDAERYPEARVVVIGSPRLDELTRTYEEAHPSDDDGCTVATTFHWPQGGDPPEAKWAYPHYRNYLCEVSKIYRVLAHAHPRIYDRICGEFGDSGCIPTPRFEDVLEASALSFDNTSGGIEFAAITGKPLLFLNAPWYRRNVSHGGRFWNWIGSQVVVDGPEGWVSGFQRALDDPPEARACRDAMVRSVYTERGDAASRAASVIERWLEDLYG